MMDEPTNPTSVPDDPPQIAPSSQVPGDAGRSEAELVARIRKEFEARLLQANLRTEAVRAGMIDLDGLKLLDLGSIKQDDQGNIENPRAVMAELRRKKPWLFAPMSSSSSSQPPSAAPQRLKMAVDMSDEEYSVARSALIKNSF